MLDLHVIAGRSATPAAIPQRLPGSAPYRGPDRRQPVAALRNCLTAALDEIDYGMVLLTAKGEVRHINHAAEAELDTAHPLHIVDRRLRARRAADASLLNDALLGAAQRRLRKLVSFGEGAHRINASIVPLAEDGERGVDGPLALLVLGKRRVCEALTVHGFARSYALTGAETRVLTALCNGVPPTRIATELGVAISTVRTQIGTIRIKTGSESIRALVQQVAQLPPLMSVLRGGAPVGRADSFEDAVALTRLAPPQHELLGD